MITITNERPDTPDALALIDELEGELAPQYPAESRHGYDVRKLIEQGVAFFVVRVDGVPAGCGGIQLFGTEYGELKRMYTRPTFRGQRLAEQLIDYLATYAQNHGVSMVRLETGIHQQAAIRLYERYGFTRCGPFGAYSDDPLSVFMEKRVSPAS
jgi:ribosomal protein S18 acetylase RimI-like enzyme